MYLLTLLPSQGQGFYIAATLSGSFSRTKIHEACSRLRLFQHLIGSAERPVLAQDLLPEF